MGLLIAAYLLAAGTLAWRARHQINPDGVAYAQVARHYARGRIDQAIGRYWSPLLPWLLVPAAAMGIEPVIAFRGLSIGLGAVLAMGIASLARSLSGRRAARAAFALALVLALRMIPEPVTPDLLLAAILAWYLAVYVRLLRRPTVSGAVLLGLLGGLGYLAKHYALPFVAVHLLATAVLVAVAARHEPARARKRLWPLLSLAVAALPVVLWVATISIRAGGLTIGGPGERTRAFDPHRSGGRLMAMERLQAVPAGKITPWEDPFGIPAELLASLSPAPDAAPAVARIAASVTRELQLLAGLDLLGLLLAGAVVAVAVALSRAVAARRRRLRLALAGAAALYAGGYALLLVEPRYLWPIWGVVLALAVDGWLAMTARLVRGPNGRRRPRRIRGAVVVVLVVSAMAGTVYATRGWTLPGDSARQADGVFATAEHLRDGQPLASNKWHEALGAAYWSGQPLLGTIEGRSAEAVASELAPFGAVRVLVFYDAPLAEALAGDPRFVLVEALEPSMGPVYLLAFRPAETSVPADSADCTR